VPLRMTEAELQAGDAAVHGETAYPELDCDLALAAAGRAAALGAARQTVTRCTRVTAAPQPVRNTYWREGADRLIKVCRPTLPPGAAGGREVRGQPGTSFGISPASDRWPGSHERPPGSPASRPARFSFTAPIGSLPAMASGFAELRAVPWLGTGGSRP
jgi:hypothetical protein